MTDGDTILESVQIELKDFVSIEIIAILNET